MITKAPRFIAILLGLCLAAWTSTGLAFEPDVILDSHTAGVVTLSATGGATWGDLTPAASDAFRGASKVLSLPTGSGYFEFHTTLPKEGPWQVYIWHCGTGNNASSAIITGADTTTVSYSQSYPGQWVLLGTYWFTTATDGAKVKVSSVYNKLSADAVRFSFADPSIILDTNANTSPSVVLSTGQWTAVTPVSGYGGNLHRSKTSGATATFKPTIPTPGDYDLSIWLPPSTGAWLPAGESAVTSFGVDITTRTGTASATVTIPTSYTNQGQWVQIGTASYRLDATGVSTPNAGRVIVNVTGSTNWVPADAVRWTKVGGAGYVMDEDDGPPLAVADGAWTTSTQQTAQVFSSYRYLPYGPLFKSGYFGSGGNSNERGVVYKPAIQDMGLYDMYLWYPGHLGSGANPSTQLEIQTALGLVTTSISQQSEAGKWNFAGRYILNPSTATPPPQLRLSTPPIPGNGNYTGITGYVIADGVMFLRDNEDKDSDSDGLPDWREQVLGTNPNAADTDGDGMPDAWEVAHGLNPLVDDSALDPDGDGWTNLQEYLRGGDPQVDFTLGQAADVGLLIYTPAP